MNMIHPAHNLPSTQASADIWQAIRAEAEQAAQQQPIMASFFHSNILNHSDFAQSMSFYLSALLASDAVPAIAMRDIFSQAMCADPSIERNMLQDLLAHYERDPACQLYMTPLLFLKGYHALQSYRIANHLWHQGRRLLANYLQHRAATLFDVDIHPAATIKGGLMIDHGTGVVIGQTTVIEEDVSMLHAVTLGGSGAKTGQRHPTIKRGVLLSVGAKVLGNIVIGEGAKVGAGSVVLEDMPAHATVVGVPARAVGKSNCDMPALEMDHDIECAQTLTSRLHE